jgi:hypothetical protein
MRKDPISVKLSDSNNYLVREWQQRMELPNRTASINQLLRIAELTVRFLELGGGLDNGRDWKVPPKGTLVCDMTEQQRELFFQALSKPSTRMQYNTKSLGLDNLFGNKEEKEGLE